MKDASAASGIAVWVRMGLAPGVVLETRSGTHWRPTLLTDREAAEGAPEPSRSRSTGRPRGAAGRLASRERAPARSRPVSYSPLFAWGIVRAALARR